MFQHDYLILILGSLPSNFLTYFMIQIYFGDSSHSLIQYQALEIVKVDYRMKIPKRQSTAILDGSSFVGSQPLTIFNLIQLQLQLSMDISVNLNELSGWFQDQLDAKYGQQMQNLKRVFIVFYNLAGQVIDLYFSIRERMQTYAEDNQLREEPDYKNSISILNKSLFILNKMADLDKYPVCLDYNFCQKFVRLFEQNLNILCTLYHAFLHVDMTVEIDIKTQRQKIVEGINKLYGLHSKIKEYSKQHSTILKQIHTIKKLFTQRTNSIQTKLHDLKKKDSDNCFDKFQRYAIQFYASIQESIKKVNESPQAKRNFMKSYFHLLHQLYAAQAKLEILLQVPLVMCQQIKNKRKKACFGNQDVISQYSKWVNSLLKQGSSLKNIKKIKIQDFMKYTLNLLKQKDPLLESPYLPRIQQIEVSVELIIEITKQCQKIEQSDLMNMIAQYKKSILPPSYQKIIGRLIDYQHYMAKYYQIHEQMKDLNRVVKMIGLKQLGVRVNIQVNYQI